VDQPVQNPPKETDSLSERQLRALLEAREAEKESQRKELSRRATRLFLFIGSILLVLCVGLSYLIEWQRDRHAEMVKKQPPASKPVVDTEDAHFAKELFEYVVPPPKGVPVEK